MAERRPLVLVDGRMQELPLVDSIIGITSEENMTFAKQTDFFSDSIIYKGEAAVGSATSSALWRIHKLVIGVDGDVSETWASGDANFNKVWDDRVSLTYS